VQFFINPTSAQYKLRKCRLPAWLSCKACRQNPKNWSAAIATRDLPQLQLLVLPRDPTLGFLAAGAPRFCTSKQQFRLIFRRVNCHAVLAVQLFATAPPICAFRLIWSLSKIEASLGQLRTLDSVRRMNRLKGDNRRGAPQCKLIAEQEEALRPSLQARR
jgi:hypothetical protein